MKIYIDNSQEMLQKSRKFPYTNIQISSKINNGAPVLFWKYDGKANIQKILSGGHKYITKLTLEQTDKFLSRKALQIADNLTELKLFNVDLSFDALYYRRSHYFDIRNRWMMDKLRRKIQNSSKTAPRKPLANSERSLTKNVNNLRAGPSNQQQTEQTSTSVADLVHIPWTSQPSTSQAAGIRQNSSKNSQVVELKNLKFLEIKTSSEAFVVINAPQLETLVIHDHANLITISDFLKSVPDLKSLIFNNFHRNAIKDCENFQFSLQKLSMNLDSPENNFINLHEAVYVAEIIKFLKLHKNLTDLSLNFGKLNNEVSQVISLAISDLNLKKFKLFCELSDLLDFFPKFNPEIEELSVNGTLKVENLEKLICACPRIKSLKLDLKFIIQPNFIESISHYLHNLKYLTIKSFITQIPATTIFKNVEYLKITNIHKESIESAWYDLVMACPNVKELTFLNYKLEVSLQNLQFVKTNSKNLKILNFICEENFCASDEFLFSFLDKNLGICELNITANNVNNRHFHEKIEILTHQTKIRIRCMDL